MENEKWKQDDWKQQENKWAEHELNHVVRAF